MGVSDDEIVIDARTRRLDVSLADAEIQERLEAWTPPTPRYTRGVMAKYAKSFSSASQGAVTG